MKSILFRTKLFIQVKKKNKSPAALKLMLFGRIQKHLESNVKKSEERIDSAINEWLIDNQKFPYLQT